MSLTPAQRDAIAARGNVLVMAGAGTGKTRTLVERCLDCLLLEQPPASIDEILMVTFTEAAAAEMRKRIRERLEEESLRNGVNNRWQEQLALFETAHFGTLHSFCLQLVRQHFYQLELDPQLSVLAEEEARLLAEETLDNLFQRHYSGTGAIDQAVQRLIQSHGRGWDLPIRSLVLRLHHYSQTLPNPTAWLDCQSALFDNPEPMTWRGWWQEALARFPEQWLAALGSLSSSNVIAAQCEAAIRNISPGASPAVLADVFVRIAAAQENCPPKKRKLSLRPLELFLNEAAFLGSFIGRPGRADPLTEDWSWVRHEMSTLVELAREFSQAFCEAKRELAMVDFHDLEQYALRLLWDHTADQPTSIARHWRDRLRFIFVDEYQDINAAQDQIIKALAREGSQSNRFLVGDVKQSIYRFRLANPYIFQNYAHQWRRGAQGTVLPLADNFRSREPLLQFVNSLFGLLITQDSVGINYAAEGALQFGAAADRAVLSAQALGEPAVESHFLLKSGADSPEDENEESEALAEVIDLQEADKEARLVAMRLREVHAEKHPVWDLQMKSFRPVDWKDMAILLRSPAKKAESYAKEFARLNLPLQVARTSFYRSIEVSDLLSLLQLFDNPLQDLPLLAVLHSPLVGLSATELAEIRLVAPKARFWTTLNRWHRSCKPAPKRRAANETPDLFAGNDAEAATPETHSKVGSFLARFARWRRLARQAPLSACLETVLSETHYTSWLLTQPRGTQRQANVQRLVTLAQEFDRYQRQGLFRFLKLTEARQIAESEPEVAASTSENAVRLMSIHQSKGLEFPVVVVADLGKPFNLIDLHADIILDEQYRLCPQIKPPETGKRYPSISYWLARRRQLRELLGEELRLLYVATTRARDTLILSGAISSKKLASLRQNQVQPSTATLLAARSYIDWFGLWFSLNVRAENKDELAGKTSLIRWFIHDQSKLAEPLKAAALPESLGLGEIDFQSENWQRVQRRLTWQYPFSAATQQPAKTSVSALRRQAEVDNSQEAAAFWRGPGRRPPLAKQVTGLSSAEGRELTSLDIGNAHHEFLQQLSLTRVSTAAELAQEAKRLESEARLAPEHAAVLDFESLAHFWNSELGRRVRTSSEFIQRELAFTARFTAGELTAIVGLGSEAPEVESDFVLVQGVVDLAVIAPKVIWLIDFKTDELTLAELADKVKAYGPQLKLYSKALSKIYLRPVSESWLYFLSLRKAVAV
jgi:ATP-dependent helicase/nuclease subunit A